MNKGEIPNTDALPADAPPPPEPYVSALMLDEKGAQMLDSLAPGTHKVVMTVNVPPPESDKTPVASQPLVPGSKVQVVTVAAPPKPAPPDSPGGFPGQPSPHNDSIGRPPGFKPKSIFDFK